MANGDRNFYLTKSCLYRGVLGCKSHMEDIDGEFKVEVARYFVNDSNYPIKNKSIMDILSMYPDKNTSNIRNSIADIIINDNFYQIEYLLMGQLLKYTARASGVPEKIFYGE